jgi:RimJ/RimL family protein N-acetyltransferase
MAAPEFVPPGFDLPRRLDNEFFILEPLGPRHNEQDYAAWSSSMEHIHATPGWENSSWPRAMTLAENRDDLERHARDFERREGFTYTVLDRVSREVIGCVYIYPAADGEHDAAVSSWVREGSAELDRELWAAVSEWLAESWPFERVEYAARR